MITPAQLQRWLAAGERTVVVDVRTSAEIAAEHPEVARSIPVRRACEASHPARRS